MMKEKHAQLQPEVKPGAVEVAPAAGPITIGPWLGITRATMIHKVVIDNNNIVTPDIILKAILTNGLGGNTDNCSVPLYYFRRRDYIMGLYDKVDVYMHNSTCVDTTTLQDPLQIPRKTDSGVYYKGEDFKANIISNGSKPAVNRIPNKETTLYYELSNGNVMFVGGIKDPKTKKDGILLWSSGDAKDLGLLGPNGAGRS